jgi:hypothetical protein
VDAAAPSLLEASGVSSLNVVGAAPSLLPLLLPADAGGGGSGGAAALGAAFASLRMVCNKALSAASLAACSA